MGRGRDGNYRAFPIPSFAFAATSAFAFASCNRNKCSNLLTFGGELMLDLIVILQAWGALLAMLAIACLYEGRVRGKKMSTLSEILDRIDRRLGENAHKLDLILHALKHHLPIPTAPTSFVIQQLSQINPITGEELPMSTIPLPQILGITLGNTGVFNTLVTAPSGGVFPAGTTFTWSSSDSLTTLTPSADTTSVAVATTTSDTATSFVLTCVSSYTPPGASAPLQATATVPFNPAVVTPPPAVTAFAINQVS
jgi:hypothetical protein